MKLAFSLLLALHGAIHLPGFAKGTGLAELPQLKLVVSPRVAWLWLAAAIMLIVAAALVHLRPGLWWWAAGPGVVLSQLLVVGAWHDAKYGTIPNLIALVPLIVVLADFRSGSLRSSFDREVQRARAAETAATPPLVTDADLTELPPPIQRYLRRAGIVGKPRVRSFHLHFDAQMRGGPDEPWMQATAEQYEFFHPPVRLFLMKAWRSGIPFDVLHRYIGNAATMEVRIAGLIPVRHLVGEHMTQSETVTLFNDICLLAPAALLDANVRWQLVNDHSVRGIFTNAGHTISAVLSFSDTGDVLNFTSDDRFRALGDSMVKLPFSTPVSRVAAYDGVRLVADGEARYTENGHDWAYGRFILKDIRYNIAPAPP